jgi:hypothetical protein
MKLVEKHKRENIGRRKASQRVPFISKYKCITKSTGAPVLLLNMITMGIMTKRTVPMPRAPCPLHSQVF